VDCREGEALSYGVRDMPSRPVAPFRLQKIRTGEEDVAFARRTIEGRLRGNIWRELTKDEAMASRYLSREFVSADADGKKRSVSDFSLLSTHWDARLTRLDTLAGSAALSRPRDNLLTFD
jgi:hypothetical protein